MFLIRCLQTAALNKTKWEWNTEKVVENDEKRFHAVNQLSGWDLLGSWELSWCSDGSVGVNFAWRDVYNVREDFKRFAVPLFHFRFSAGARRVSTRQMLFVPWWWLIFALPERRTRMIWKNSTNLWENVCFRCCNDAMLAEMRFFATIKCLCK